MARTDGELCWDNGLRCLSFKRFTHLALDPGNDYCMGYATEDVILCVNVSLAGLLLALKDPKKREGL